MRPRSASEMSRGDLLKREETRRKVKERHAAELDSSMTAHPKLTRVRAGCLVVCVCVCIGYVRGVCMCVCVYA